ncbi:MAG TPA: type-F conjugative transfer system secretin TraK [Burkholderiales bacterium]|nr:type-F conjugative transfer system secretin TraK [Burkholderiales bacterium]
MIHSTLNRLALLTLGLALNSVSLATQTVELVDGMSTVARISQKEATRITVEGARIVNVTGNIQAEKNPDGEIVIEKDETRGQIFVRPAHDKTKPVNLFISTEKATYTLLLQPIDIPADTIIIRDRSERRASGSLEQAGTRKAIIKRLVNAMASGLVPDGVDVSEVGREVRLWQEARFTLQQTFTGRSLIGEKYLLGNVSNATMVLEEPEFFKDGVVSVTVENQNLPAGASTNVFIVRERGRRGD